MPRPKSLQGHGPKPMEPSEAFPNLFGFAYDPASSTAFGGLEVREFRPTKFGAVFM